MSCSCCTGETLDIFSERRARKDLRRYLDKGLVGADALRIVGWAEETGLAGRTVLEVGGGVGQLQVELLRRGAERGEVVEVLEHYRPLHDELAAAAGVAGRTSFRLADLVDGAPEVAPADVVVLRRVVCCSPAGPALLAEAARRTTRILLASYPVDRRAVRIVVALQNALFRLVRRRFRVYLHDPAALAVAASAHGLDRVRVDRGRVWEVAAYERADPGA